MAKPKLLIRLFKGSLVQIIIIGVAIFGGYQFFQKRDQENEQTSIHIDLAQIEGMITQWERRWSRPPTQTEIDGLIQQYVREEVLYRQAVAMGLDKNDSVTRRRTVQKLEFLTNDIAISTEPTESELEQYLVEHEAEYRTPDLISFVQVFFNPDERKESTLDDAKAELEKLIKAGEPDPETLEAGDGLLVPAYFELVPEMEVARQLGSGFAEPLMKLEIERWHGPVLSIYGVHLVYVSQFQEGAVANIDDVRETLLADWYAEQRENLNADMLETLKKGYEIVIDEITEDRLIGAASGGDPAGSSEIQEGEDP